MKDETKKPHALLNRLGKFYIAREYVIKHPDLVLSVMGHCIPFRTEFMLANNSIEYRAYSYLFDEATPGATIPEYAAVIERGKDGECSFKGFKRK